MPAGPPSWPSWSNRHHVQSDDDDLEGLKASKADYKGHDECTKQSSWQIVQKANARQAFGTKSSVLLVFLGMLLGYAITHIHSASLWSTFSILPKFPTGSSTPPDLVLPKKLQQPFGETAHFYPALEEQHYPAVPAYNVLSESSDIMRDARRRISQKQLTPLFVPFTRKADMVTQTVLSYIAAGWPREQIYVIDNSGTMDANPHGKLSAGNPFSLDYELLRGRYGVNIMRTPTLLNFAQLQNYVLEMAMAGGWEYYYWTRPDITVLGNEAAVPYLSFYENIVRSLLDVYDRADPTGWTPEMLAEVARKERDPIDLPQGEAKARRELEVDYASGRPWGIVFHAFAGLTLMNVKAAADEKMGVGAWDILIPYYGSDCDYYERLRLTGWAMLLRNAGVVFDVFKAAENVESLFFADDAEHAQLQSDRYRNATAQLLELSVRKDRPAEGLKTTFPAGRGEPWTYDPHGYDQGWWYMADVGRQIYQKKWGTDNCRPSWEGKELKDMWKSPSEESRQFASSEAPDVYQGNEDDGYVVMQTEEEMQRETERQIERQWTVSSTSAEDLEERCLREDGLLELDAEELESNMLPESDSFDRELQRLASIEARLRSERESAGAQVAGGASEMTH
ncbi:hypothetical protein ABW21_db0209187 [Orbilia brochopaga]|nr:hypothetical protein ABW21_db0209187 [Drechslerella brochopaga]